MNLPELKRALQNAEECTLELLTEVYATCQRTKRDPEDVFATLPKMSGNLWRKFAEDNPPAPQPEESDDEEDYIDVEAVVETVFHVTRRNEDSSSHMLYPKKDQELRIVDEPLILDTCKKSELTDVALSMNMTLSLLGTPPKKPILSGRALGFLDQYFSTIATNHPRPVLYAQPNDPSWCMSRRTVEPDHSASFENWQRFLGGFEDPEAYAAKIYAILCGVDTSRQALVTRSTGRTGKTCAMAAIASVIGNDKIAKPITGTHVSSSSRFLASNYVNSALIYAPDCNVKTFLLSEVVKQLTGSDRVLYEVKGGAYGTFDPAGKKLIVNMNPRPLVLADTHSTSRILYLEQGEVEFVDLGNAAYTELLKLEMAGFLAFGERCFQKKWHNQEVKLNERAQQTFENLVGGERREFFDFVGRNFELADTENPEEMRDFTLSGEDLTRLLQKQKLSEHQRNEWREWLLDLGVIQDKRKNNKVVYNGIRKTGTGKGNGGAASAMGAA